MKISDKLESRENNFDFLRFFAASLVVFSHSFPLFGIYAEEPLGKLSGKESLGGIAVIIFFVMSGFLIGKSWIERPRILTFVWNRFLRIFPGFVCVILFAIFVVGPLVTTLDIGSYFKDPKLLKYAKGVTMFPLGFDLPGVFEKNAYPLSVNASLWSLPLEVLMYVGVLFFGIIGLYRRRWAPATLTGILIFFNLVFLPKLGLENSHPQIVSLFKLGGYFFIGLCAYVYKDHIRLDGRMVVAFLLAWVLSFKSPFMDIVGYVALPYAILFVGLSKTKYFNVATKYGDFSYGMYIYAFPIQQTLVHFYAGKMGFSTFFLTAYVLTLFAGITSWHLVEKRALKFKKIFLRG